ncbi:MAG: hypothetical protein ACRDE2_17505, partial [Chitinophagaceae bacterium]
MFREYDITQLFEITFGYKPKPYNIESKEVSVPSVWTDKSIDKSKLFVFPQSQDPSGGETPYYDSYVDPGASASSNGGTNVFMPAWLDNFALPYPV